MIELWLTALASQCGVIIETDDVALITQRLYAARRKALDSDLDALSVVRSPTNPNQLWIVKRGPRERTASEGNVELG